MDVEPGIMDERDNDVKPGIIVDERNTNFKTGIMDERH
jgi:hypothetical protein